MELLAKNLDTMHSVTMWGTGLFVAIGTFFLAILLGILATKRHHATS